MGMHAVCDICCCREVGAEVQWKVCEGTSLTLNGFDCNHSLRSRLPAPAEPCDCARVALHFMFVVAELKDFVRVAPKDARLPRLDVLTEELNAKFGNKVIPDVGLCLTVYDILAVGDGLIYAGEGYIRHEVHFRLVVFRPHVGEILVGRVAVCTAEGVQVSLGFFADIFVPANLLRADTTLYATSGTGDEAERAWVWQYDGTAYYMDPGEEIRVRVHSLEYYRPALEKPVPAHKLGKTPPPPPRALVIVARTDEDGLGLTKWWREGGEQS